jgi:hypothetical protein
VSTRTRQSHANDGTIDDQVERNACFEHRGTGTWGDLTVPIAL